MVLSFHPNIVAHRNIICAGRLPNHEDEEAIQQASAVLLSQGCSEALYKMCRTYCPHVFPNYDARFDFPGKLGQAGLFEKMGVPFPQTYTFSNVFSYNSRKGHNSLATFLKFPCVFKFNWGGEGDGVLLLTTESALKQAVDSAAILERSGEKGFLLQEYVPCAGRSLRVVIIGDQLVSYWRRQEIDGQFLTNVKAGAVIDHTSDPELQEVGRTAVQHFCTQTGVNLAGFDLLFSENAKSQPLFLEINYFFGRRGLGGSLKYYELVKKAVRLWLQRIGLSL